ncbi:MAG: hypothetical protein JO016_10570 [Actinobacteria bacterium]|nr:hypothetical protein [Actinomycetota bacterium]
MTAAGTPADSAAEAAAGAPAVSPAAAAPALRPDRVYLGWQYALIHPHPGLAPRRPTPPAREQLNPGWAAAQRREQRRLDRPLEVLLGAGIAVVAGLAALGVLGLLDPGLTAVGMLAGLIAAVLAGREIRRSERLMRARLDAERERVAKIATLQEARLFEWQAQHAEQTRDWQARRAAYERQKQWFAISLGSDVDRIDVAGGTLPGWSALVTTIGLSRLQAGGEVTVIDLTDGAVAHDLLAVARQTGLDPLVWVLFADLPRLDLGTGLEPAALADLLTQVTSEPPDERHPAGTQFRDHAILDRIGGLLGPGVTVAQVCAALRVLGDIGDLREDAARGLLSARQIDKLATMFGRGADQAVAERAAAMEAQLRLLASVGTGPAPAGRSPLRVVSAGPETGVAGRPVLGRYLVAALTQELRSAAAGTPWQHTVILLGADQLPGPLLDRLADVCAITRTGLVPAYRSIPAPVRDRLGHGNAAVAFMRLGNAADAKAASEQIGTEHRLVLAQLTDTVGASVGDTSGESYTSTLGTSGTRSRSDSASQTSGRSRGRAESRSSFLPLDPGTRSRSGDTSESAGWAQTDSISTGISESTAWGISTSQAVTGSESQARTVQRSREFLVEQHELQQLPPSAMIVSYAAADGRHVVLADANPGLFGLPTATLRALDEARAGGQPPTADVAARPPAEPEPAGPPGPAPEVSWRDQDGESLLPPNLGPPPERLDWRRRPHHDQ